MQISFNDGDNFVRNMVSVRCCGTWSRPWLTGRKMTREDALPVSIEDLLLDLRIDSDDEAATVERMARGAAEFLERRTAYVLIPGRYQVDVPGWWDGPLEIQRGPLREIVSIQYLTDATTEVTADPAGFYVHEEDRIFSVQPLTTFTRPTLWSEVHRIRLTFDAGFQTPDETSSTGELMPAPDGLLTTFTMLVGHYYKNRELFAAGKIEQVELGAGNLLGAYRQLW